MRKDEIVPGILFCSWILFQVLIVIILYYPVRLYRYVARRKK